MWSEIISTLSENWPDSLPHILIFYILFHVYLDLEKKYPLKIYAQIKFS